MAEITPKIRDAAVRAYLDKAKAVASRPLAVEEKAAEVKRLKDRLPGYEKQFLGEGERLKEAESAGDVAKAEGIRDVLEANFRERKRIVARIRALGGAVTDRTDGR